MELSSKIAGTNNRSCASFDESNETLRRLPPETNRSATSIHYCYLHYRAAIRYEFIRSRATARCQECTRSDQG